MFGFLKKKKEEKQHAADWGFIKTDIHSHILPGIDDGAKTVNDSIQLIKTMYNHGYRKMIATPHVSQDIYPNTKETILEQRDLVREKLAKHKIDMKIDAAAEYMIDEKFVSLVESGDELLTIHDNCVLVEMSYMIESPCLDIALFALQTRGYQPILAHPERYNFYHENYEKYDELKEKGCLFQLNMIAFSGYYGRSVKQTAEYLFDKKMYSYSGSDIHHLRHAHALNSVFKSRSIGRIKEYPFLNKGLEINEQLNREVNTLAG